MLNLTQVPETTTLYNNGAKERHSRFETNLEELARVAAARAEQQVKHQKEVIRKEDLKAECEKYFIDALTYDAQKGVGKSDQDSQCLACELPKADISPGLYLKILASLGAKSSRQLLRHMEDHIDENTDFDDEENVMEVPGEEEYRACLQSQWKTGTPEDVEIVLDWMDKEGIDASVSDKGLLISSYLNHGQKDCAERMLRNLDRENATMTKGVLDEILSRCKDGVEAETIIAYMRDKSSIEVDSETKSRLLKIYCKSNEAEEAWDIFSSITDDNHPKGPTSFLRVELCEDLLKTLDTKMMFRRMVEGWEIIRDDIRLKDSIEPTQEMYRLITKAYVNLKDFIGAHQLLDYRSEKTNLAPAPRIVEVVMHGLVMITRNYNSAVKLFESSKKQGVTMGSAIYKLAVKSLEESGQVGKAIDVLREMKDKGLVVDESAHKNKLESLLVRVYKKIDLKMD